MAEPTADPPDGPAATRRELLLAAAAVVAAGPAEALAGPERGEPFDDGTWFDDGYGWVD